MREFCFSISHVILVQARVRVGSEGKVKQRFKVNRDGARKSQGSRGEVAEKSRGSCHGGSGISDGEDVGRNGPFGGFFVSIIIFPFVGASCEVSPSPQTPSKVNLCWGV